MQPIRTFFRLIYSLFCTLFCTQPRPQEPDWSKVWVTRERKQVLIRDMDDQHLTNTIFMLMRRAGRDMVSQLVDVLTDKIKSPNGRFNHLYISSFVEGHDYSVRNFAHPAYEALVAEYKRRKLPDGFLQTYEVGVIRTIVLEVQRTCERYAHERLMQLVAEKMGTTPDQLNSALRQLGLSQSFYEEMLAVIEAREADESRESLEALEALGAYEGQFA